ncbi:MAG TPA: hypothetical protein VHM92_11645 [Allosphingosinicella sp.]|nr:hypothetical protein [Allosphingosinicella sp.]
MRKLVIAVTLLAALGTGPALANSLVSPGPRGKIARSNMSVSPAGEWNRLSLKAGKNVEVWTLDGPELNKVTFYGGIAVGQPLVREVNKKNAPLPRVSANMLITDIPAILETTYRAQFNASQITIDSQEPTVVSGHKGIAFTYFYVRPDDEVQRKGEAVGAVVGDRLYLVTYEAPAIHFFDKDESKFRQLAATLKF